MQITNDSSASISLVINMPQKLKCPLVWQEMSFGQDTDVTQ